MEQQLMLSWWMVGQLVALTLLLGVVDGGMIYYAVSVTKAVGASMMIVFGFEYALQAVDLFGSAVKCALNVVDVRMDHEWEEKSSYVFYLELLSDTIKLGVYISFVYHLINSYGPPIHILRDVYLTARSFYDKCRDWMRYRQAMRNMNQKYQTVSQEQLSQLSDTTCIICREDMEGPTEETIRRWQDQQRLRVPVHVPGSTPKRLPCGHIFHFNCLRGWLERQQACPTCRRSVLVDHVPQASSNTAADPRRTVGRDEGRATSSQVPATTAAGDAASGDHSWQRGARSEDATPPGVETTFASPHWRGPRQQHQQQGHDLAISLVSRMFPGAKLIPLAPSPTSDLSESSGQPSNSNGNTTSISSSNIDPISGFLSSRSSVQQLPLDSFPLPDLSKLSDAQLHDLETNTRRGIEGRLRVLAAAQHHLDLVARLLTRVQSVLPEASLGETKAGTGNSNSVDTTGHTSSGDIRSTDKGKQAASSLPNEGSDISDI
ncbi:E3 ubiquitin-protein ligase hrd1 [Spiromyces aspiralis]|uniref:E3 ubiquitin-protein ligase hrd1 n=1 Tax=Spiromyces aspiralis TaxID=68401 RepID=A0ACC1HTT0_9FUNG|nr:E3 ubiquitin-protein ligase hrd1 [Spiromyces aspiralis]